MLSTHASRMPSWAICLVPTSACEQLIASMRHLASIRLADSLDRRRQGRSLWIGSHADQIVGIAWHWGEVRDGVLALADPMLIDSNIRFARSEEGSSAEGHRILLLNHLVHSLDWQSKARRVLAHRGVSSGMTFNEALAA